MKKSKLNHNEKSISTYKSHQSVEYIVGKSDFGHIH